MRKAGSERSWSTCSGSRRRRRSAIGSPVWTCRAFTEVFAQGGLVETGDLVPASDLLSQLGTVPGLFKVLSRLGYDDSAGPGQVAAAAEFTSGRVAPDSPDR